MTSHLKHDSDTSRTFPSASHEGRVTGWPHGIAIAMLGAITHERDLHRPGGVQRAMQTALLAVHSGRLAGGVKANFCDPRVRVNMGLRTPKMVVCRFPLSQGESGSLKQHIPRRVSSGLRVGVDIIEYGSKGSCLTSEGDQLLGEWLGDNPSFLHSSLVN